MSIDAVRTLLEKAEQSPELNAALEAALRDAHRPVESFLTTAREHGCEFSADEFLEVMGSRPGSDSELSESQLESVAGGLSLSSSWSNLATRTFRSYRSAPSIQQIGVGGIAQAEEEDEIQT